MRFVATGQDMESKKGSFAYSARASTTYVSTYISSSSNSMDASVSFDDASNWGGGDRLEFRWIRHCEQLNRWCDNHNIERLQNVC